MFDQPITFVDIETTGGSPRNSRVLEVAALRYEDGQIVQEFSTLIQPDTYVPRFISNITGITDADVRDAPRFADIAAELHDILDGAIFAAHNVNFDYSFIKNEYALLGATFKAKRFCTVRLSRFLYPNDRGHSLQKLIERHDLPFEKRHRALDDAKAIVHFSEIAHQTHGSEKFRLAVEHQLGRQYTPDNMTTVAISEVPRSTGVYIFRGKDDEVLYVGKSVDMNSRVKSHLQDVSEKEQAIARAAHRIETIETADELLALVLEAFLVKKLQPFHNRKLRKVTSFVMAVRSYDDAGYPKLTYRTGTPDQLDDLGDVYGLYESKLKAKKWNETIVKTYDLCPKLMGLEAGKGACFGYALGKCRGACVGVEPVSLYEQRFETALSKKRLQSWPVEGAVTLPVGDSGAALVVDKWQVVGSENLLSSHIEAMSDDTSFDYDVYRLLRTKLFQ